MEYKNTEDWILNRLPFYQNKGSDAYNPGLSKINKFIKELSLSKNELKFIHVGGTNGKGSTSSFISSILKAPDVIRRRASELDFVRLFSVRKVGK